MFSLPISMCTAMCTAALLRGVFPGQLHLYTAPFVQLHTRTGSVCPCFIHPFQYSYSVKAFQKPDPTFAGFTSALRIFDFWGHLTFFWSSGS